MGPCRRLLPGNDLHVFKCAPIKHRSGRPKESCPRLVMALFIVSGQLASLFLLFYFIYFFTFYSTFYSISEWIPWNLQKHQANKAFSSRKATLPFCWIVRNRYLFHFVMTLFIIFPSGPGHFFTFFTFLAFLLFIIIKSAITTIGGH